MLNKSEWVKKRHCDSWTSWGKVELHRRIESKVIDKDGHGKSVWPDKKMGNKRHSSGWMVLNSESTEISLFPWRKS